MSPVATQPGCDLWQESDLTFPAGDLKFGILIAKAGHRGSRYFMRGWEWAELYRIASILVMHTAGDHIPFNVDIDYEKMYQMSYRMGDGNRYIHMLYP